MAAPCYWNVIQHNQREEQKHYYKVLYPYDVTSRILTITQLEALNLVHAVSYLLPQCPPNFTIIVNTDNSTSQQVLSSGNGKDHIMCACVCQLWLLAANLNLELEIVHKPGSELIVVDALSRSFSSDSYKAKAAE